jgi:internalin A
MPELGGKDQALARISQAQAQGSEKLDLSSLGLTSVPAEIGKLSELKSLSLDYNRLSKLPRSLTKLHGLGELSLRGNQLKELPEHVGQNVSSVEVGSR